MRLLWMVAVGWALAAPLSGQSTPYLPLSDPAWADLDALVDAGWARGALLGQRPWSRLTAARLVADARRRADADSVGPRRERFEEALARLEESLGGELATLCAGGSGCPPLVRGIRARSAATDATWARSPSRSVPTSYDWETSDYIDADINPLLQRNQGRVLADGWTLGAEGVVDATFGARWAAQLHPRVWALDARGADASADLTLLEGYARALFGNLAVEIGRNHLELSHGREAGPALSRNARGLDLIRLSLDRPARLPWKLRALGTVGAAALVADMGGSSDTPHSKLIVFEGVLRPHRLVEVTATLLNHQGGEGAPTATFVERLQDIFLIYPQGPSISDKIIGAGVAVSLPSLRSRVYADFMTTDDHDLFRAETDQALGTEAVWIGGARVTGLGAAGRLDLWAEGRTAGVRPQTHHEFTSGLTLDRRLLGDALGPLARALAGGVEWRGPGDVLGLELAREQYNNADRYAQIPGNGRFAWERIEDRADEVRERVVAEWRRDAAPRRPGGALRLGYERVTNFDFAPVRRSNLLAQLRADFRW